MEPVKADGFISKETYDRWKELNKKIYKDYYKKIFSKILDFVKKSL